MRTRAGPHERATPPEQVPRPASRPRPVLRARRCPRRSRPRCSAPSTTHWEPMEDTDKTRTLRFIGKPEDGEKYRRLVSISFLAAMYSSCEGASPDDADKVHAAVESVLLDTTK